MVGRIIETESCVAEGAEWLARAEPRFAHALALTGPLPLRRRADGFAALAGAIVSQQVSVAAANAIWARLSSAGFTQPGPILAAEDDALRACGLSRQKVERAVNLSVEKYCSASAMMAKTATMTHDFEIVDTTVEA